MVDAFAWTGSQWSRVRVWNGSSWASFTPGPLNTAMGTYHFTSGNDGWSSSSVTAGATQGWHSNGHIYITGEGGLFGSGASHSIYPTAIMYLPQGTQFKLRAYIYVQKVANGTTGSNVNMSIRMDVKWNESSSAVTFEVSKTPISDSGWGWGWFETPVATVPAPTRVGSYTKVAITYLQVAYDEDWLLATPTSQHVLWLDQAHIMNTSNNLVYGATTQGSGPLRVWDGTAWV